VTNQGDTLAPPRTTRPRHKATPARTGLGIRRPGPGLRRPGLPAALRKVTPAWPDRVSIPAGTGGGGGGGGPPPLGFTSDQPVKPWPPFRGFWLKLLVLKEWTLPYVLPLLLEVTSR
jgi:hypothetical protein